VAGVITSPRTTFADVVANPRWAGVLLLTTLVTFACSAALLRTQVGQVALVDQWERTGIAFGASVGDAEYARLRELSRYGVAYAALTSLISGPVMTVGLTAVLTLAVGGSRRGISFRQALAVTAHAGIILMLRQVVTTPLNYVSETLASPTTLNRLAGALNESSPAARFLSALDLFVIWWIVVLAVGLAVATHRPIRRIALALAGAYVILAIIGATVMAITGGAA
jgi:hypothetical protein